MSKPETPCHPDCYVGAGGSILHAPGCTKNAPKAEAPPSPQCNCPQTPGPFPRTAHGEDCDERPNRLTVDGPPANVSEPPTNQTKPCHPECREVCDCDGGMSPQCTNTVLRHAPACPNAPVSEPPNWDELVRSIAEDPDDFAPAMAKPLDRAYLALKAQLDTDREVLKETENNISNLAKFAASPITPNYNLPMSGLAIAIRDSLAAALGREILLTQEWDALKAQNVELAHEIALAAENWAEREESFNVLDGQVDRLTAQNADLKAELERLRDLIVGKSDGDSARDEDGCFRRRQRGVAKFEADHEAFEAEADSVRAAREAGKA